MVRWFFFDGGFPKTSKPLPEARSVFDTMTCEAAKKQAELLGMSAVPCTAAPVCQSYRLKYREAMWQCEILSEKAVLLSVIRIAQRDHTG